MCRSSFSSCTWQHVEAIHTSSLVVKDTTQATWLFRAAQALT
jgi:hypothetical protein